MVLTPPDDTPPDDTPMVVVAPAAAVTLRPCMAAGPGQAVAGDGNMPRLMRMEFGRDGLRWLRAEFAEGLLAARCSVSRRATAARTAQAKTAASAAFSRGKPLR